MLTLAENTRMNVMRNALLDLTQSDHEASAGRARAALFDAGILTEDHDGGVAQALALWEEQRDELLS